MYRLILRQSSDTAYLVQTAGGQHVGNLKLSLGQWKFKAIGYDTQGKVMPGWGPLTDRHNTVLDAPDEALVNRALSPI